MYSVLFEPPASAIAGLTTGKLERIGAVIRDTNTKKIAYQMRETSAVPSSTRFLGQGLPPQLQQAMGLAFPAVSMLNLGATVAFGAATLHKLNKIDQKLDRISEKLDVVEAKIDELSAKVQKIAWAVDIGFASTLRALGILERFAEAEIIGQLTSAAQSAWSCQFLEPGSPQRMMRIENALSNVGVATERLAHIAYSELEAALESIQKSRAKKPSLKVNEDVFKALMRMRQLAVACSVRANIMCESGDLFSGAALTKNHSERLGSVLKDIGQAYLNVGKLDVYKQLTDSSLADAIPASRLDYWTKRFDPSVDGALGLMDALRRNGDFSARSSDVDEETTNDPLVNAIFGVSAALGGFSRPTPESEPKNRKKAKAADPTVVGFFDLVDSCWEDVDRLSGYALEMDLASKEASSWQEYRECLLLEEIPDETPIVFFSRERGETLAA